jgi:tetratricopeptide (TPR) repeat protein
MRRLSPLLALVFAACAGLGVGWLLGTSAGTSRTEDTLGPVLASTGPNDRAPVLDGVVRTAAAVPSGATGGPGGAVRRPVVPIATQDRVEPVFTLAGRTLPEGMGPQVLRALALLHAAMGHVSDFEEFFAKGLEASLDLSDLLTMIDLLPVKERLGCIDRLLAGPLQERSVPPVQLARLLAGAGARERALTLLKDTLAISFETDAATALLELDPKGGAALLLAHEGLAAADDDVISSLAGALLRSGQEELAWPFVDRIVAKGNVPSNLLEELSNSDAKLGLRIAERLLAGKRDDPESWFWLARMRERSGDPAGAFEAYQQELKLGFSQRAIEGLLRSDAAKALEVTATLDLSSRTGSERGLAAVLELHRGQRGQAFDTLAKGLSEAPDEYSLLNAVVRADPARATALLRDHLAGYSGSSRDEVTGAYAHALRLTGRTAEARQAYLDAIETDPADSEWYRGLARVDPARAIEALEARREASGNEEWWQESRAEALLRNGQVAEGRAILERDASDVWSAAALGVVDAPEARRRIQAVIAANPRDADGCMALGEMERDLGNVAAARAAFEEAVRRDPTSLWNIVRLRQVSE